MNDLTTYPTYKVVVDYKLDLAAMIVAGKYDWVNKGISDMTFPRSNKQGTSEVELVLVHLDRHATADEVVAELDKHGLRSATIEELLAFGAAHPELQRQFPIVALGSSCAPGGRAGYVPLLCVDTNGRELDLLCYILHFYDEFLNIRFLAVPK